MNEPARSAYDRRVAALIQLFTSVSATLERILLEAITSGKIGTARYKHRRLTVINSVLAELRNEAIPEAESLVQYSFAHGLNIADSPELDPGVAADFAAGLNLLAVDTITGNLTNSLDSAIQMVGRRANDAFRRATLYEVGQHLLAGSTVREAAESLKQRLISDGKTSFVDKAGRRWSLDVYASMAIRTTTREAVTLGAVTGIAASGKDLIEISTHANSCPVCLPHQGKTYSISGRTPGYVQATREDFPPYHGNCSHVVLPARANFELAEQQLLAGMAA